MPNSHSHLKKLRVKINYVYSSASDQSLSFIYKGSRNKIIYNLFSYNYLSNNKDGIRAPIDHSLARKYGYTLMIFPFITTVIGYKPHEIEILVNTIYMYSSYGLPILEFQSMSGSVRIRDYRCMKRRITTVLKLSVHPRMFCINIFM